MFYTRLSKQEEKNVKTFYILKWKFPCTREVTVNIFKRLMIK